ncbi:hypothetical protein C1708_21700 [Streptomyces sp. DH-12]|nr:hypothetical protein C1708_21700 [Streptomyces sp. DH-12]
MREQSFELREHRLGGFGRHLANLRVVTAGPPGPVPQGRVTIQPNPPGGVSRTAFRTGTSG